MDALTKIINIICKRDSDTYQDISRDADHEQIMAEAIEKVLDSEWESGKAAGIMQEQQFWLGRD